MSRKPSNSDPYKRPDTPRPGGPPTLFPGLEASRERAQSFPQLAPNVSNPVSVPVTAALPPKAPSHKPSLKDLVRRVSAPALHAASGAARRASSAVSGASSSARKSLTHILEEVPKDKLVPALLAALAVCSTGAGKSPAQWATSFALQHALDQLQTRPQTEVLPGSGSSLTSTDQRILQLIESGIGKTTSPNERLQSLSDAQDQLDNDRDSVRTTDTDDEPAADFPVILAREAVGKLLGSGNGLDDFSIPPEVLRMAFRLVPKFLD